MNAHSPTFRLWHRLPRTPLAPTALTIGNFDGVHLGHQAMLARLCSAAAHRGLVPTVLTFEPHPREFFAQVRHQPDFAPPRIHTLRDKIAGLRAAGVQQVIVLPFNQALAHLSAEDFLEDLLVRRCNVRWLLVGDDFRFGAGRRGDAALLRERNAFEVEAMSSITDRRGHRIASTDIRAALQAGNLPLVAEHLGRPYAVTGHVVHGLKLGRNLGFPTLNLRMPPTCRALTGIFTVAVHGLGDKPLQGVASLGVRPTVTDENRILLEVHLLDFQGDAYGRLLQVEFLHKLRDEAHFPDLATLTRAIAQDVVDARDWFAQHPLPTHSPCQP